MTRSEFFKRLGLGALVCAVAPKMLVKKESFNFKKEAERIGTTDEDIIIDFNNQNKTKYIDLIEEMKLEYSNYGYIPEVVLINPLDIKKYIDISDSRIITDNKELKSICGLRVIKAEFKTGTVIVTAITKYK